MLYNKLAWCGLLLVGIVSKVVWIESRGRIGLIGGLSLRGHYIEFETDSDRSKFVAGDFSFYARTCRSVVDKRYAN